MNERKGNGLFNDTLNTFYLQLYGVGQMVKDRSDSERGKPLPPHGLLFPINSNGSFICTIPQTGLHIPWPLLHQSLMNELINSLASIQACCVHNLIAFKQTHQPQHQHDVCNNLIVFHTNSPASTPACCVHNLIAFNTNSPASTPACCVQ